MTIKSDHALLYHTSYPFKDGSHDENKCSNSLTLDGTKISALSYYQKLGALIPLSKSGLKKMNDKHQFSKSKAKGP